MPTYGNEIRASIVKAAFIAGAFVLVTASLPIASYVLGASRGTRLGVFCLAIVGLVSGLTWACSTGIGPSSNRTRAAGIVLLYVLFLGVVVLLGVNIARGLSGILGIPV